MDYKIGDRVKVEFEGTVTDVYDDGDEGDTVGVETDAGRYHLVNPVLVTKIKPALPTKVGSVIRITEWCDCKESWTALLTETGWRVSVDSESENSDYRPGDMANMTTGFEVIYEPEESA